MSQWDCHYLALSSHGNISGKWDAAAGCSALEQRAISLTASERWAEGTEQSMLGSCGPPVSIHSKDILIAADPFCKWEVWNLSCKQNQLLYILWGRMRQKDIARPWKNTSGRPEKKKYPWNCANPIQMKMYRAECKERKREKVWLGHSFVLV